MLVEGNAKVFASLNIPLTNADILGNKRIAVSSYAAP